MNSINLASELIKHRSVTYEDSDIFAYLNSFLQSVNFDSHVVTFSDDNYPHNTENLVAQYKGIKEYNADSKHLIFSGHLDTVPTGPVSQWAIDPFSGYIDSQYVHGRGSEDMKGPVAAFIVAAKKFIKSYPQFNGLITLAITGDEEATAINGTVKLMPYIFKNTLPKNTSAIVGEPTSVDISGDTIQNGRRGSISFTLKAHGVQGHVAYQYNYKNPIYALFKLYHMMDKEFNNKQGTFSYNQVEMTSIVTSSNVYNVIPATASSMCNIRFNDHYNIEKIKSTILNFAKVLEEEQCRISVEFRANPYQYYYNKSSEIYDISAQVIKNIINIEPKSTTDGGSSDASMISKYCPVIEIGPRAKTLHQLNERISIKDLQTLEDIYFGIIKSYFNC